ncbi:MAG: ABC transporter ATP-binding protein [Solirubrobacterales bacterium]
MTAPLLEVEGLRVTLPLKGEQRPVLHDVSLSIGAGECLGLVGESGSGKSMTARAIVGLLPRGARPGGGVRFEGESVLGLRGSVLRKFRGRIGMVFQDPRAHVNPVRRVGEFLTEVLRLEGVGGEEAAERAVAALAEVGIEDGGRRMDQYPHQLSGGLLQRVMIAAALLGDPLLLLADEPTSALDVTTQAEVMAILDDLRRTRGLGILFITHDLDLATAVCDSLAVMYAGSIVEQGAAATVAERPSHPYTAALARARPRVDHSVARLPAIGGRPVSAFEAPAGCAFARRCPYAIEECSVALPELRRVGPGKVRCIRAGELSHV